MRNLLLLFLLTVVCFAVFFAVRPVVIDRMRQRRADAAHVLGRAQSDIARIHGALTAWVYHEPDHFRSLTNEMRVICDERFLNQVRPFAPNPFGDSRIHSKLLDPWGSYYNVLVIVQDDLLPESGARQKVIEQFVWSNGPNKKNDNRTGDDVVGIPGRYPIP